MILTEFERDERSGRRFPLEESQGILVRGRRRLLAHVMDFSSGGFGLVLNARHQLQPGQECCLQHRDQMIPVVVKHVHERDGKFICGVKSLAPTDPKEAMRDNSGQLRAHLTLALALFLCFTAFPLLDHFMLPEHERSLNLDLSFLRALWG